MRWTCDICGLGFHSKCVWDRHIVPNFGDTERSIIYVLTTVDWIRDQKAVSVTFSGLNTVPELIERLEQLVKCKDMLPALACDHHYVLEGEDCDLEHRKEGLSHKTRREVDKEKARKVERDLSPRRKSKSPEHPH